MISQPQPHQPQQQTTTAESSSTRAKLIAEFLARTPEQKLNEEHKAAALDLRLTILLRQINVTLQTDLLVNWAHAKSVSVKRQYINPDNPSDNSFKPVSEGPDHIYNRFVNDMLAQVRPVAERVRSHQPFKVQRSLHPSWWVEHLSRESAVQASNCQNGDMLLRLACLEKRMLQIGPGTKYDPRKYD